MPKQNWLPEFDLDLLRMKMAEQGVSVQTAANVCGIARTNMSDVLRGKRKSLPALRKLTLRLGLTLQDIIRKEVVSP